MAVLTGEQIIDLVNLTRQDPTSRNFTCISQELQQYPVMSQLLKDDKMMIGGGTRIVENLQVKNNDGAAAWVGLHHRRDINITDLTSQMVVYWKHINTHYAFERREALFQQGAAAIVHGINVKRNATMLDLAKKLEDSFWTLADPNDSAQPWTVPYYIVKNATAGFNGGNPAGYSDCAGLSSVTYPTWSNYTFSYTNVSKTDFIAKARTAARKTNFVSPVDVPEMRSYKGQNWRLYTNEAFLNAYELKMEDQNDNLGRDGAPFDNTTTFKRNPIIYIPKLDASTDNPVYFINHDTFKPVVLEGDYMYEHPPATTPEQPNSYIVNIDNTMNFICFNRRLNAVAYAA